MGGGGGRTGLTLSPGPVFEGVGPGGGGSISAGPGGSLTLTPGNSPLGPIPIPGPITQGGGAGCGCGGGGIGGGSGGGSPGGGGGGTGPRWTLKGSGGPGGGLGGIILTPQDGPIGPVGTPTGSSPVAGAGPGGSGTTGSCGTPAGSCSNPGGGAGGGAAPGWPGPFVLAPPIPRAGGGQGSGMPPIVLTPGGGGSAAIQRAALMPAIARSGASAAADVRGRRLQFTGRPVRDQSGHSHDGHADFAARRRPFLHRAGVILLEPEPSGLNELGGGWLHTFKRQVQVASHTLTVVTGSGQSFAYGRTQLGGFCSPESNTMNSLQSPMNASTATETQPDGTLYQYGSPSAGALSLQYIQNPAGQRWTVTYDGSGRVSFITDPMTRRTTLTYDATSGKITSILDPFGRATTITVNGSGDLVQVLSPELCVTSMVYDSGHRMTAWINPLGDRTSFAYGTSQLVLTSPLSAVTTLVSSPVSGGAFRPRIPGSTFTNVTSASGSVATLSFDTNGNLVGATDAVGNITSYSWDVTGHLLSIGDGVGNVTSFGYVTNATNKIEYLSSITQPLGGIFTYTYNSSGQVSALTDQLGPPRRSCGIRPGCGARRSMRRAIGRRIRTTAWVNWLRSRTRPGSS